MSDQNLLENLKTVLDVSRTVSLVNEQNTTLFDYLDALNDSVKKDLFEKYNTSEGVVLSLRKKVAEQFVAGPINRGEIEKLFAEAKKNNPTRFTVYKNLFSILYPFVVGPTNDLVYDTLSQLAEQLQHDLQIEKHTTVKLNGFDGSRNTGDTHAWFAIYNNSHPSQKTALQLFFSIKNGVIAFALYDRKNDNYLERKEAPLNDVFYSTLLAFFNSHKDAVLKDNYHAQNLLRHSVADLVSRLKSGSAKSWLIKPGRKASLWKNAVKTGTIFIGWGAVVNEIVESSNYSNEFIIERLNKHYPKDGTENQSNNRVSIQSFLQEVGKNDLVFASSGRSEIIGVGVVTSDFLLDEDEDEYSAYRSVDWLLDLIEQPYQPPFTLPIKTVTKLDNEQAIKIVRDLFENPGKSNDDVVVQHQQSARNLILFGPPGTGKTFNSVNHAISILENKSVDAVAGENRENVKARFDRYQQEGRIVFTTFHQSMSYEDFVEGIKPQSPGEKGESVTYEVEDGIFKRICNRARFSTSNFDEAIEKFKTTISAPDGKSPLKIVASATTFDITYRGTSVFFVQPLNTVKQDPWYPVNIENIRKAFETENYEGIYNPTYVREVINHLRKNYNLKKPDNEQRTQGDHYVLIIDEINRGNIAQIFGELITLIEEDKRLGRPEALEATLPYSKDKFGVPPNLYIIATMNTADRSVEALDTALRRRFSFLEMQPKPDLIATAGKLAENGGVVAGVSLPDLVTTINKRIEKLLDKDHLIGHSYLMEVDSLPALKSAFQSKIIPLLQEYFYGDFGKIGLVLGTGFFEKDSLTASVQANFFADFPDYETVDLLERRVYRLMNVADMSDEAFLAALEKARVL